MKTLKTAFLALTTILFIASCSDDNPIKEQPMQPTENINPDVNSDSVVNVLLLGTSKSISAASEGFNTSSIATQLENILAADEKIGMEVNVVSEDIFLSKDVTFGLGQAGNTYTVNHEAHSLAQYYYWPEGQSARWNNLSNASATKWDYVIIAADPYLVAKLPGYYALGVNKIASKVAEGSAKPMLLMVWDNDATATTSIDRFAEFAYRTADGAKAALTTIPAARAWDNLPESKQTTSGTFPSANAAYLTAASIYASILKRSAADSDYQYDDEIAASALATETSEAGKTHFTGAINYTNPFTACDISDNVLNYNHTGTSSENGILAALNWVVGKTDRSLVKNGTPPINFNYGRANTNFEPNKRYEVNPAKFDFSLGFPMQDHSNHGNNSMLYGLDYRLSESNNSTDVGTALYMVRNNELPNARAIPIRTLFAQMRETIPSQSAYGDSWHMNKDLDKASATFMYTMLTGGECSLAAEPSDQNSAAWRTWYASKVGYETAYTLMYLKGNAPSCN